jgi:hypothetical protein
VPLPTQSVCACARPSRRSPLAATLTAALLLALAFAAPAPPAAASPARVAALLAGDFLEDDAALLRWPGSARDHAGILWLDSGRVDPRDGWRTGAELERSGPAAGLAWRPGAGAWTAAVAAHARAADGDHAGLHRDGPGASFAGLLGRTVGPLDVALTWRRVRGDAAAAGDGRDAFTHRRDDLGLGLRCDLSPTAYLDLAADVRGQRNRLRAPPGAAPDEPLTWPTGELASWRSWSARARAFVALGERAVLTPVAEIVREDFAGPVVDTAWYPDATWTHANRLVRVGLGATWLPDPDRLALLAVERLAIRGRHALPVADSGRIAEPRDMATFTARLAVEQRLCWWLSLRAAVAWTHRRDDLTALMVLPEYDGPQTEQRLDAAAGLALHLGVWGADLSAGGAPLPEPWLSLAEDRDADPWLHATLHREF